MSVDQFFASLWEVYTRVTPQAQRIQALFKQRGETVINDHIAFRTFAHSPIALEKLEPVLASLGYSAYGAFRFENKHLKARCYQHQSQADAPKIFLSELLSEELPEDCQAIINKLVAQIPDDVVQGPEIFWSKCLWQPIAEQDYLTLQKHSEYAAWLSTMGMQANHFTVSINHLTQTPTIEAVNQLLLDEGYTLNQTGGLIKGSPELYLEQSSTMADKIEFTFAGAETRIIPSCFYEFALRHQQPNGELFDSFIEGNADKIFDSTNTAS
ncbi:hypothetical protein MAQ5080_03168 [Marinomonas aquimarina]|uniref:2-oxoadipate dioxygenase/decarboxylase n=1 Tax=Marinomonas aquimarina TaxID=295068 RepID=A0A1A8TNM0_9GAMM|nr:DUF1338 domain-containing protein [Marinomonas aquimarina]SBS35419.1 hypothetical protein MAQ5080_03168 [Marinomonas aquimarina]